MRSKEFAADEDKFLKAVWFHMAPEGRLVINVPAGQWAYSAYDRAVGHIRRYSLHISTDVAERNQLGLKEWTYWGLPLVPVLLVRRLWPVQKEDLSEAYSAGFDPWSAAINSALGALSRCEWIPQKMLGTSLMAVLQRRMEEKFDGGR